MSGRRRSARRRADLSQHFLRSGSLARRLVALSSISQHDLVVEAGPGRGMLTRAIAERCRKVVAVEIDRDLVAHLGRLDWPRDNVEIVGRDFLDYPLPRSPYKFFANAPFARTADIVRKLALSPRRPDDAYLVMQAEAAVRFLGLPFGPESELSLVLKAQFDLSVVAWLSPTDFDPPPSVNSVLLRLCKQGQPRVEASEMRPFRQFARGVMRSSGRFDGGQLRRTVGVNQARGIIRDLNFPVGVPPSSIAFEQWLTAFRLRTWNSSKRSDSR